MSVEPAVLLGNISRTVRSTRANQYLRRFYNLVTASASVQLLKIKRTVRCTSNYSAQPSVLHSHGSTQIMVLYKSTIVHFMMGLAEETLRMEIIADGMRRSEKQTQPRETNDRSDF